MISLEDVRHHLRDTPGENFLLDREEFDDHEIELALHLAIQDYNSTPPLTTISPGRTPPILDHVLMLAVLSQLYRGKSLQYYRNQLDYSDGGIQVATHNKGPYYDQASQRFQMEFDRKVPGIKSFINLNDAYGEVSSDYSSNPPF